VLDAARYVRPAIDEVTEKDQRVRCLITRQKIEQRSQLRTTAVNVTNDECFHSCLTPKAFAESSPGFQPWDVSIVYNQNSEGVRERQRNPNRISLEAGVARLCGQDARAPRASALQITDSLRPATSGR